MEANIYQCPYCNADVLDEGDKVVMHKMLCRGSYDNFIDGNILRRSTMDTIFDLLKIDPKDFPKGVHVRKNEDRETVITYSPTNWYWAILLITGMMIYSGYEVSTSLYVKLVCWGAVGVSLLLLAFNLIYNLFARWVLTLKDGKGVCFCGLGKYGKTVTFEYNNNSTVSVATQEDLGPGVLLLLRKLPDVFCNIPVFVISHLLGRILEDRYIDRVGITLTTDGMKYNFGGDITENGVMKYVAAYLLREIALIE